jgi:SAM-dependent methyltransferase
MRTYNTCRCCGNDNMEKWVSLPPSPVANALFHEPNYDRYPLDLIYCANCEHIQLASAPDPDGVFTEYRYKSGVSGFFIKHFEEYAKTIDSRHRDTSVKISENPLNIRIGDSKTIINETSTKVLAKTLLEIGSNDGYLLKQFKDLGWDVIGVEPSEFLKQDHIDKEISVVTDFFNKKLVKEKNWLDKFSVICANNVLAHIPDMQDVAEAISQALMPHGVLIAECGDQIGIVNGENLDNVYHEHIDYYSPYSFAKLFEKFGLIVENIEQINSHGISFRITLRKDGLVSNVEKRNFNMANALDEIAHKISSRQTKMQELVNGRPFYVYGAAAKAVTALYTLNLIQENLIGAIDDNELKQNCYFPGTGIRITNINELDADALVVVAAWNVFDDIKAKLVARGHRGEIICMQ